MASLTQWTGVWVNSGSWWRTGRPGVLQFMGSQRVRHDWATELTEVGLFLDVLFCFDVVINGIVSLISLSFRYSNIIHFFIFYQSCCSVAKWCPTHCAPMDCIMPGCPVLQYLLEFAQTHVHGVGIAIQPSSPLLPSSPPAINLSQHQGLFQWI